jgi:hypothetical protein
MRFFFKTFETQKRKKEYEKVLEEPGFEPGTFRMQSRHSTTELHPLLDMRLYQRNTNCTVKLGNNGQA